MSKTERLFIRYHFVSLFSTPANYLQRCRLITGTCIPNSSSDFISIKTTGSNNLEVFPEQTWPIHSGHFKALVMLSPGPNTLEVFHMQHNGQEPSSRTTCSLQYIPLLQYPPLHLAIMVAKDSPLLMDCPPQKAGGLSSAHSDLNAAVEKFRMTAYMWQAMTAEDMRSVCPSSLDARCEFARRCD